MLLNKETETNNYYKVEVVIFFFFIFKFQKLLKYWRKGKWVNELNDV